MQTAPCLLRRHDLADIGDDGFDALLVEFAGLVGVIGADGEFVIKQHGDVGVLGDVVGLRAGRVVDAKNQVLEAFLAGQVLQRVFKVSWSLQKTAKLPILALLFLAVRLSSFFSNVVTCGVTPRAKTTATGLAPLEQ